MHILCLAMICTCGLPNFRLVQAPKVLYQASKMDEHSARRIAVLSGQLVIQVRVRHDHARS